jgi:SNF2 family DNA or RNA helicase
MNRNDLVLLSTELETMPETSDEGGKILTDKDRTKSENLEFYIEKVMNSEGPKSILIFAEYDKPLLEITDFLNAKGYRYSHLKGSSTRIVNIVEKYKKNEIDILLLNSKYFGSGLNLENTTHLFMYHKMIDHLDKQVIGRAQRPGRTQPLELFRLCYSNEAATQSD